MVVRTSIFDRLYERRMADEALARQQAEQAAAEVAAAALLPVEIPVTPMVDKPSRFDLGGFLFELPASTSVRDMELTLDHEGEAVLLAVRRRDVGETPTLADLFTAEIEALEQRYPHLHQVRRRESLLAGNKALALDYQFLDGHDQRHGRLVAGLIAQADNSAPQWLSIRCTFDPNVEALGGWLLQFDQMLDGLAGV